MGWGKGGRLFDKGRLLERGAKTDIKVGTTVLSFCHVVGFFSSRPCDISQLFVA